MVAFGRQAWIITSFIALIIAGITVSACGWILFWRDRKHHRAVEEEIIESRPPGY